MHIVCKRQIL